MRVQSTFLMLACLLAALPASAQPDQPSAAAPASAAVPADPHPVVSRLQAEAAKLRLLVKTDAVRAFLDAVPRLPEPTARATYRSADKSKVYSQREFDALTADQKTGAKGRKYEPPFYYYTGYGSPLIYARPLDLLAERAGWAVPGGFKGKRILDFGYGLIGHLRLLALRGADVTGIDVEPVLRALYSDPSDTGEIDGGPGMKGKLRLLSGRWPADESITAAAAEGGPYDLFISKNVLKRGYIHPAREADERQLVKLGVEDAVFIQKMHDALKPGGFALIYNISPAQSPDDQPYLPHADGQCPFPRESLEAAGFEVLAFDAVDQDAALDIWAALGIEEAKSRDELRAELFAWYTLLRRK